MLLFDAPVFHFLNANTQSPLWCIQASRFASNWLPGLCARPVIAAMLARGKGWRRSLQLALLSMACASNAASTRGFAVEAKPQRKRRHRDWPGYVVIACCLALTLTWSKISFLRSLSSPCAANSIKL